MPSEEDSGSRTLNCYRWQSRAATRDLLMLVLMDLGEKDRGEEPSRRALISEHHEDWVVIDGDRHQLVSAKHRDLGQGPWTWATLMSHGGIPHLHRNYRRLSETPQCRMVTNQAIHSSPETRALRDLCQIDYQAEPSQRHPVSRQERDNLVLLLARHLLVHHERAGLSEEESQGRSSRVNHCAPSSGLLAATARFLDGLSLDTGLPGRRNIDGSGPLMYAAPVLKRLGHSTDHIVSVWEALTGVVEQSMEAQLPTEEGELSRLIRSAGARPLSPEEEATDTRTVTSTHALAVIEEVLKRPRTFLTPPLPYRYKVSVKMDAGDLEANDIQRAEDRMELWRKTLVSEVDDAPGNHAQVQGFTEDLENRVDDLRFDLREEGVAPSEAGHHLWNRAVRLPPEDFPPLPFRLTRALLTGAVSDAADHCRIWFTPYRFDASRILLATSSGSEHASEEHT